MTIIKPTVGLSGWNSATDKLIDIINQVAPDAVNGRVVRVGPVFDVSVPTGTSTSGYLVIEGADSAQDRSILFRTGGHTRIETGCPGDDDYHIKVVSGATEAGLTFTDALIVKQATGYVWVPLRLGVGTIPVELLHVAGTTTPRIKVESTAGSGDRSAGVILAGPTHSYTIKNDVGGNGGDNLGILSATTGYPPEVTVTPGKVGIATDSPGAALDVNGAVNVRGDNGLSAMRIRGRKTSTGAPTTGTWAVGDVIMDSAKVWWLCTAAGTPGTWV